MALLAALPYGGSLAAGLIVCSGIVAYDGVVKLGPILDDFASDLLGGHVHGLGAQGLRYLTAAYVIILLVALPVAYRGAVAEARHHGFRTFGCRRWVSCAPCCASCCTGLWSCLLGALLWLCVLLAVPLLCVAEAYYLLFGVLFFSLYFVICF